MNFKEIQDAVKRAALKDKGGTVFDTGIKTIVNRALLRVAREAPWRVLRRKTTFSTKGTYNTGSGTGTFPQSGISMTVSSATFLTDGIEIGRRVSLSGDNNYKFIEEITGETTFKIDSIYTGDTTSSGTYSIVGQEEYNLPIQVNPQRFWMWHLEYGVPTMLNYITDQDFYSSGADISTESVPEYYRVWGNNTVQEQMREASTLAVYSSSSNDTSINITIFGTVAGYPDSEIVATDSSNGTASSQTTKTFQSVERIVKDGTTEGRIIVTANSHNTTVTTIPVGDITDSANYTKIQLYPLPTDTFDIHVQYYKDPYLMVNDEDVHELGTDFDNAIIYLATAIVKYENNQSEGDKFTALFQDEMRSLRRVNSDKIDWIANLKRPKESRHPRGRHWTTGGVYPQQIGPYYSNRSW
jgi:hypothetical protein